MTAIGMGRPLGVSAQVTDAARERDTIRLMGVTRGVKSSGATSPWGVEVLAPEYGWERSPPSGVGLLSHRS